MSTEYDTKDAAYFSYPRGEILSLLPHRFSKVIDIGGGSGATLDLIKSRFPQTSTICADNQKFALERAARSGHWTVSCNLEQGVPPEIAECDVVLCLDVLEHLLDPWSVLAAIRELMPSGATVIVSLPNVRFLSVSADLLFRGRWELQDTGVLDRTHLRFFTRRSALALLDGAGFTLSRLERKLGLGRRGKLLNFLTAGLFKDLLCVQILLGGVKP
ncbi:MAG TPA: class I SAM-dependent methyltransferase [Rhizomicrobium sp.]|jgi:2-polyprenyl-3-methyl-5-hydroxy-6-metoxy-1,4-benzoquinol methylase|nr:class I SAM-dependent methyltransferase [Rhizomicrobium sp.]